MQAACTSYTVTTPAPRQASYRFQTPRDPRFVKKTVLSYTCNQLGARGFDRNGAADMASPSSTPSTDPTHYLGSDEIPLADKRTGYHYTDELPKGKPGSKSR